MKDNNLISASQAAEILGVSKRRVLAMINAENPERRLPAVKVGNSYVIRPADLDRVRERRAGRPRSG